ncbi:hypothetical protein GP2_051_00240 [Gordonia paraffinivorans NBRC 108238]|uniref:Uncharacterized protein n=1 Tax=Gordonia paraffinivorans NBRC 108238 TaxID=1223543 RepID=A0ABQ0IR59_9ACTN|nr:hypothetical protein GP2_051_00240 [Gordonia paraffinivorans NBRC 108238]
MTTPSMVTPSAPRIVPMQRLTAREKIDPRSGFITMATVSGTQYGWPTGMEKQAT